MSDPTHIISMTQAAFWTARETAADERQAQIVKWLRDQDKSVHVSDLADAIERGEHLKHAPE